MYQDNGTTDSSAVTNSYFAVFQARRGMIAGVTASAFVLAVVISLLLPKVYSARALVVPSQEDKGIVNSMLPQLGGLAVLAGGALGGTTTSDLYVGMLKSEAVKDPVIDRFKLMSVYDISNRLDTYAYMDRHIAISAGKKDGIVSISVEDRDPKRAADIANAYVDELQKLTVSISVAGAGQNRTYLDERLAKAKTDLAGAEERLKAFQGKNKAVNVTEQAKASIEGIAHLKAQLALQEVQLATLQRQFTDDSQEVKSARTSIANLRGQIGRMEGAGGTSAIPSVGSMPAIGEAYARLMRDFKIQENLVEILTKQLEVAKLTEARDISPLQVIRKARVPDKKIKPKRGFIIVMSTFTAFLGSLALAVMMDRFGIAGWEGLARRKGRTT